MSRGLGGLLLLIAGLLGLFMTLCGGYFSLWGFGSGGQGMLVMSVPSLLAGVWLLSIVRRRLFAPGSGGSGDGSTGGGSTGAGSTGGNDPTTPP